MNLYTCDVSKENLMKRVKLYDKFDYSGLSKQNKKKKKVLERINRKRLKKSIIDGKKRISEQFTTDKEL